MEKNNIDRIGYRVKSELSIDESVFGDGKELEPDTEDFMLPRDVFTYLTCYDGETDQETPIGHLSARVVDIEHFDFFWFDGESQELCAIGEVLNHLKEAELDLEYQMSPILCIERIDIDEAHRGKNLGHKMIESAVKLFAPMQYPIVFLQPSSKTDDKKLKNWYRRMGFRPFFKNSSIYAVKAQPIDMIDRFYIKDPKMSQPTKGYIKYNLDGLET